MHAGGDSPVHRESCGAQVNAAWAGLGYYRRARYLLEGAQFIMREHGGSFPCTSKELQKIPGMWHSKDPRSPPLL